MMIVIWMRSMRNMMYGVTVDRRGVVGECFVHHTGWLQLYRRRFQDFHLCFFESLLGDFSNRANAIKNCNASRDVVQAGPHQHADGSDPRTFQKLVWNT